jgi:hypothetical protein
MTAILLLGSILLILAMAVGRWWLLILPLVAWPLQFVGRHEGWWGSGLGDGWQAGLIIGAAVGVAVCLLGMIVRRVIAAAWRMRTGLR